MKSYIVKLSKRNVQPADWRRVIMPAGATFNRLCETIGTAMQQESRNMDETGRFFEVEVDGMCITDNPARRDELKNSKTLSPKQPTRVKIDKPLEQHGELAVAYDSSKDGDIQVKLEKTVEDYHFGFPTLLDGEGPAYDKDHINMLLKFVKYKKTDWDQIQHQNYQIIEDPYRDSELAQDQAVREPVKTESKKPVEVKPLTAKQHEQVAYILTAARLYGMMSAEQIVMLYNEQNASSMTAAQLEELVQLNEVQEIFKKENLYYRDGTILGPKLIGIDPEQFVSETINKPYYMPSKEEVLRYADSSYFDRTPEVVKLEKLFQKENIPQIQINRMLHTFMEGLSAWHANFNAVVGRLMAQVGPLDEDRVRDIVPVAINVANSVRLIENRGYTPQEMFAIERQTLRPLTEQPSAVKVGRNDQCPCGSGKKYKKCCGR